MNLTPQLLAIIACPKCKGPLLLTDTKDLLLCRSCALSYPVRDEIPVLLIDEALPHAEHP